MALAVCISNFVYKCVVTEQHNFLNVSLQIKFSYSWQCGHKLSHTHTCFKIGFSKSKCNFTDNNSKVFGVFYSLVKWKFSNQFANLHFVHWIFRNSVPHLFLPQIMFWSIYRTVYTRPCGWIKIFWFRHCKCLVPQHI